MRTTTKFTLLAVTCAAALALTGCAGSKVSSSPTVTDTVTSAPQPTGSAPATTEPVSPAPTTSTGTGTGTGTGAVTACATSQLKAAIEPGSGGAAGSTYVSLVLTNTSTTRCTVQGWPGVSFVGKGNGTQIGAAATFDRTTSHGTITLAPGAAATSDLRIVQAANYDAGKCDPTTAQGFRVYPPGQKASLFAADDGIMACASVSIPLLTVSGLHS